MWNYQNSDELYHHGVRGQRWGVRRYQKKGGGLTALGKKRMMSDDAKEAKALKKKKVSEMSNAELRKLNERKNLERNYKSLNPNIIKKGAVAVGVTAATLGSIVAIKNNGKQLIDAGRTLAHNMKYQQLRIKL